MAIESTRDLCLSVADAIREKKGTSELINPQDFAKEIASIEGGGSGGGGELEGEYFLAKANGRYWKFTFSPDEHYINLDSLSEEQINAMYPAYTLMKFGVVYGAAVCNAGSPYDSELRVDLSMVENRIVSMLESLDSLMHGDDVDSYVFNSAFFRVWKECDVKSNPATEIAEFEGLILSNFNLLEIVKEISRMGQGTELTDDEAIQFLHDMCMLIPSTEEEYKAARREN